MNTLNGGVAQLVEQSKKRILLYNAHVVQLVGDNGFKSRTVRVRISSWVPFNASVAQLVEQRIENPCVGGSIPSLGTKLSIIQ